MQKYAMIFATDGNNVLLLRKPNDHKNPIFRGRWTAPGGHIEHGESPLQGAQREMLEETGILIPLEDLRLVLEFQCNCDPTEDEHSVFVYGASLPLEVMEGAMGFMEPVCVYKQLPDDLLWYVRPLLELIKARLLQPIGSTPEHSDGK